jgi:amphi-Trp domain-containing protein
MGAPERLRHRPLETRAHWPSGILGGGGCCSSIGAEGGAVSKPERDVEKGYSTVEVVEKLRRLADALETGRPFRIQVSGERIRVPARAEFTIEHERDSDTEEVEFQLKWSLEEDDDSAGDDTIV